MTAFTLSYNTFLHRRDYRSLTGQLQEPTIQTRQVYPENMLEAAETWELRWENGTAAELANLKAAFADTGGGAGTFTWSDPPDGADPFLARFVDFELKYESSNHHLFAARAVVQRYIAPAAVDVT